LIGNPASQHDIADGKAAVPEQNPLAWVGPAGSISASYLSYFGVDVFGAQAAILDQRIERTRLAALRPVVDHPLADTRNSYWIDSHDPSVGHKKRARLQPRIFEENLWSLQTGRFDDDVGVAACSLDAVDWPGPDLEPLFHIACKLLARFPPLAGDA